MKPLSRLWPCLESIPGLRAVETEWQQHLGDDFDRSRGFLRLTSDTATCFSLPDEAFPIEVVQHGVDDFVGVPRSGARTIPLRRTDVAVYRFDHERLAQALADVFPLKGEVADLHEAPMTWRIGSLAGPSQLIPAHLTFPMEPSDLIRAVEAIATAVRQHYLVLAPTGRRLTPRAESLLQITNGRFIPLCDVVQVGANGDWVVDPEALRSSNEAGVAVAEEPLAERAQTILIALLESQAFDPDRLMTTQEIAIKAFGPGSEGNPIKGVISELARRKLLVTQRGPGGGCWLTESGQMRAEKLKAAAS